MIKSFEHMAGALRRRIWTVPLCAVSLLGSAQGFEAPRALDKAQLDALYAHPLSPPDTHLNVFHLGHSLVGRDMPAMLAQLAGKGHEYASQLGWGTPLKSHWGPEEKIAGFELENSHSRFRPAKNALDSGEFDAFVMTEMVEIRDAIAYFESGRHLRLWSKKAHHANPNIRLFLYETWHPLDDEDGWLNRLDSDLERYWEQKLLAEALAAGDLPHIYVIPAGQVFARFVRAIDTGAGGTAVTKREDLFARAEDGSVDQIHVNDLGAYLVALTHYAVLYQQSPVGLPNQLLRVDGSPAVALDKDTAELMQQIVWDVVTSYPKTGVPQRVTP